MKKYKEIRVKTAEANKEARSQRTIAQQIKLLKERPGESKKEIKRLLEKEE